VIDADEIRKRGFDHVWPKDGIDSAIWWGTDKVDAAVIRELLSVVKPVPSLREIHEAIRAYAKRTGQRPMTSTAFWCDELGRSFHGVDGVLNRAYGTTLKAEVVRVLGGKHDGLIEQTHELLRDYWAKGIVLTSGFGMIPELGITASALESKLRLYFKTSITVERDKVLGLTGHEMTMPLATVKAVIGQYAKRNIRITAETKKIPELGITGIALDCRLLNWYGIRLPDLVNQVADEMNIPLPRRLRDASSLSLAKIKKVFKDYSRKGIKISEHSGPIPELGASAGTICKFLRAQGIRPADLR
jgi:hypothetical protein